MKLIVEPDHGVEPLLRAIKSARRSVDIVVFRMDRGEIESALKAAVDRGVKVHALIADRNRGGEKNLRGLEMRFLEAGITVARSGDNLVRYHDKLIIIDRRRLYTLSFNFTHLDIDHSRGFGVVTTNARLVQEAVKLFEADCTRQSYTPGLDSFTVSPANARKVLGGFLKRANKQLLIYDPKISDKEMIAILQERAKAGVEVRIIGRVAKGNGLPVGQLTRMRLHARAIIRDRHQAFVGSQSLRAAELDSRREVGLIFRDRKLLKSLIDTFELDWASTNAAKDQVTAKKVESEAPKEEAAKNTGEALIQELQPLKVKVKKAVKEVVARAGEDAFQDARVKDTVKEVVKQGMKETVKEVLNEVQPT